MSREARRARNEFYARPWAGKNRHYDILKEGLVALVVVGVLVTAFAGLFSSPDDPAITFKQWASADSNDFYATVVSQLAEQSGTATYGPPYNTASDGLSVGPFAPQKWVGVQHPVDAANDFVITPLTTSNPDASTRIALALWSKASADQQSKWAGDYFTALTDPSGANGDPTKVASGSYGPVPALAQASVNIALNGAYDNAMTGQGQFFQTDQTKQLLMLGDGGYLDGKATDLNIQGNTWGMMNEAGSWPGQIWLAPWSFWYQLPVFNADDNATGIARVATDNADAIIFVIMMVVFLLWMFTPFIPVLRDIPRWIPLHRLVWKQYYREHGRAS